MSQVGNSEQMKDQSCQSSIIEYDCQSSAMQTQPQKQSTYGLASQRNEVAGKKHSRKNSRASNPFGVQSTNSLASAETENVFAAPSGKSTSRTRKKAGTVSQKAFSHIQNTITMNNQRPSKSPAKASGSKGKSAVGARSKSKKTKHAGQSRKRLGLISPSVASNQSSGNKTPQISAIRQYEAATPIGEQQTAEPLQQSSVIHESENEASSMMLPQHSDPQETDLMGSHLVANLDLYPQTDCMIFQTPNRLGIQDTHSPMTNTRAAITSAFHQHNDALQRTEDTNKQDGYRGFGYSARDKSNPITPVGPGKMATIEESASKSRASPARGSCSVSGFPVEAKTMSPAKRSSPKKQSPLKSPLKQTSATGIALNVRKATSPETLKEEPSHDEFAIQVEYVDEGPTPEYEVDTDFSNFSRAVDSRAESVRESFKQHETQLSQRSHRSQRSQHSQRSAESAGSKLEPYQRTDQKPVEQRFQVHASPAVIQLQTVPVAATPSSFDAQFAQIERSNVQQNESPELGRESVALAMQEQLQRMQRTGEAELSGIREASLHEASESVLQPATLPPEIIQSICIHPNPTLEHSDILEGYSDVQETSSNAQRNKSTSSNGQGRRTRNQRKTPNATKTHDQMQLKNLATSQRKRSPEKSANREQQPRRSLKGSIRPLNQPGQESKQASASKHSSVSMQRGSSNNILARNSSTDKQAQLRKENAEKAKQYGNRASHGNRGASKNNLAPVQNNSMATSPSKLKASPVKPWQESPSRVSDINKTFQAYVERTSLVESDHHLPTSDTAVKLNKNLSKMKTFSQEEQAVLSLIKQSIHARRIQRAVRVYLEKQAQERMRLEQQRLKRLERERKNKIKRELEEAERIIERKRQEQIAREQEEQRQQELRFIQMHENAAKIQRAYRAFVFRCTVRDGLAWRRGIKTILTNVVEAWRTRRALNCLGLEVQEFVNCEVPAKKAMLRAQFHEFFAQVLSKRLYLEPNSDELQKMVTERNYNSAPVRSADNSMQEANEPAKPAQKAAQKTTASSHTERTKLQGPAPTVSSRAKSKGSQPPVQQEKKPRVPRTQRGKAMESSRPERTQQMPQNQYQSTESILSIKQQRNSSIEAKNLLELKQFIQESGTKNAANESVCSIQVTTGIFAEQENPRRSIGSSKGRSSVKNIVPAANGSMNEINELESPAKTSMIPNLKSGGERSSAARPLNLNLGSATRFSNYGPNAPSVERKLPEENTDAAAYEKRKQSADACAAGYRTRIRQVKSRVDCWNKTERSGSRGEITPARQERNLRLPQVLSQSMTGTRNRGADQFGSTQKCSLEVMGEDRASLGMHAMPLRERSASGNKLNQTQTFASSHKTEPHLGQRRHQTPAAGSSVKKACADSALGQTLGSFTTQAPREPQQRLTLVQRQTNAAMQASAERQERQLAKGSSLTNLRSKSQLMQPTKFNKPQASLSSTLTREAQQKKPESSTQQAAQPWGRAVPRTSSNPTGSNLKSFITGPAAVAQQNAQRQTTPLRTAHMTSKEAQQRQNNMRETLASLTQLMEGLAQEAAEANQKKLRGGNAYMLNSEKRAALKTLANTEKSFRNLMSSVDQQYEELKAMATPAEREAE